MILIALVAPTQSRAKGYVSMKSRKAAIDRLYQEGLITPPVHTAKYVVEFLVKDRLKYVEQVLTHAQVAYRKGN